MSRRCRESGWIMLSRDTCCIIINILTRGGDRAIMRSLDDDILCSQVPRPGPGCGYTECAHCDTPPAPPPARSLRQPPPPLPPKPPWLRPALVESAVPRSRPASYNENISSPAASFNESSSETTETSCSTEQETVIYSRSVRLGSGAGAHSEVRRGMKVH